MSQQKINNLLSLDDLSGLPNESTADKNALWERLEGRLQKKSQRSKAVWYWIAAACIAFSLSLPFILSKKEVVPEGIAITKPVQKQIATVVVVPEQKTSENIVTVITSETKETINPVIKHDIVIHKTNINFIPVHPDSLIAVAPVQLRDIPAVNISPAPDTLNIATTITPKKKIAVIHNNELEDEDRIASQTSNTAKAVKKRPAKTADKTEYAGGINFRIYLKN